MGQPGNGVIRKVVPGAGNINGVVSTVAGSLNESGNVDAVGTDARFGKINAMTYIDGKLIIADSTGAIRRYSPDTGKVEMLIGVRGETGERLGSTNVAPGVVLGIASDTNSLVLTTPNTAPLEPTPSKMMANHGGPSWFPFLKTAQLIQLQSYDAIYPKPKPTVSTKEGNNEKNTNASADGLIYLGM